MDLERLETTLAIINIQLALLQAISETFYTKKLEHHFGQRNKRCSNHIYFYDKVRKKETSQISVMRTRLKIWPFHIQRNCCEEKDKQGKTCTILTEQLVACSRAF